MQSNTQWVADIVCSTYFSTFLVYQGSISTSLEFHGFSFMIKAADVEALKIRPHTTKIKAGGMAKFQRP